MKLPAEIEAWHDASEDLAALKKRELELRNVVLSKYFPTHQPGTNVVEIGGGFRIAAVFEQRPKLDDVETRRAEAKLRAAGPEGELLADRLIKWSPDLRVGEWKKLPAKFSKLFAKAVAFVPAQASLELRVPR